MAACKRRRGRPSLFWGGLPRRRDDLVTSDVPRQIHLPLHAHDRAPTRTTRSTRAQARGCGTWGFSGSSAMDSAHENSVRAVPPLLARRIAGALADARAGPFVNAHDPAGRTAPSDASAWVAEVRDTMLTWGAEHSQSYPWRTPGLPIWQGPVAAFLLLRTRADQVAPVFVS